MNYSDGIYDLSIIWRAASEIFPYFDRCDFDWDECYREYLDKVAFAKDDGEVQLLLAEFTNLLGDGHTDYSFPPFMKKGVLPFGFLYSGGKYYIREIEKCGESFLLAEVKAINGKPFADVLKELFRYVYHVGEYIWPGRLRSVLPVFLNEKGNVLDTDKGTYTFELYPEPPETVKLEFSSTVRFKKVGCEWPEVRLYEGGTLYVKIDDWMHRETAQRLEKALEDTKPKKVILDIRDNIGGMTMLGADVAKLFISGEIQSCRKFTRSTRGIDLACASQYAGMSPETLAQYEKDESTRSCMETGKRLHFEEYTDCWSAAETKALFNGPVSILAGRDTISAAEDFLAMFKANGRAEIIGTPTCGTTGTPYLQKLRCGGGLRVCSVAYKLLDGTEFIRRGIEPDVYIEPDVEALRQGRDTTLEYALK